MTEQAMTPTHRDEETMSDVDLAQYEAIAHGQEDLVITSAEFLTMLRAVAILRHRSASSPPDAEIKALRSLADAAPDFYAYVRGEHGLTADEDDHNVVRFVLALDAVKALPPSSPQETGWRTIDSAPKDGTEFQAWVEHRDEPRSAAVEVSGHWEPRCRINPDTEAFEIWGRTDYDQDGWDVYTNLTATHWQPKPGEPPKP